MSKLERAQGLLIGSLWSGYIADDCMHHPSLTIFDHRCINSCLKMVRFVIKIAYTCSSLCKYLLRFNHIEYTNA